MSAEAPKTWARRAAEKHDATKFPNKPEDTDEDVEESMTLLEILDDPKESKLFGAFLEQKNGRSRKKDLPEIAMRIRDKTATDKDLEKFGDLHAEYLERKAHVEKLVKDIESSIDFIRHADKSLDTALTMHGKEAYLEVLRQGLVEKAMAKPAEYKKVYDAYADMLAKNSEIDDPNSPINKQLNYYAKVYKLSDEAVTKFLDEPNAYKRMVEMRAELQKGMSFGRKLIDEWRILRGANTSTFAAAFRMDAERTKIDQAIRDRDQLMQESGKSIALLISKNPELRKALLNRRPGESPKVTDGVEKTAGYAETKSYTKANVQEAFKEYLNSLPPGVKTAYETTMTPADKDIVEEDFVMNHFADIHTRKKVGFWATVKKLLLVDKIAKDPAVKSDIKSKIH